MRAKELAGRIGPRLGALVFLFACNGFAADHTLLPDSFAGWGTVSGSAAATAAIETLAGDQATTLRSCGVLSAERRTYSRGENSFDAVLYRMRDPSAAYAAYSFLRPAEALALKPTEHSTVGRQQALLLLGDSLLQITGKNLAAFELDLRALADRFASSTRGALYPSLAGHLPVRGFLPRSDRYLPSAVLLEQALPMAQGDWLGFGEGAEAELARYHIAGQEITLLIAEYPTPQVAAKRLSELFRLSHLAGSGEQEEGHPRFFVRRSSSLIALVAGTSSKRLADSLLEQVHYETKVTWNEPSSSFNQPTVGQFVVGALIGTGLIMTFALVAGVAFGGVRIVVKHFLPGVVFDRSHSIELLQLGLSSKSIEAKDFY